MPKKTHGTKCQITQFSYIIEPGTVALDEECSFVCIEMLRFGLPIISLANAGQSEILDTGLYSEYLVRYKPHNYSDSHVIEEFILKVNKLIDSSDTRRSLGNESLRIYNNSLSFNKFFQNYHNLICSVVM
jgi:glycosyltransferase involved in cell wall biosynthesis